MKDAKSITQGIAHSAQFWIDKRYNDWLFLRYRFFLFIAPFKYPRATFWDHRRVQIFWYARFLAAAAVYAISAMAVGTLMIGTALLLHIFGLQGDVMQSILAMMAAYLAQANPGAYSAAGWVNGTITGAFLLFVTLAGVFAAIDFPIVSPRLEPAEVSDDELSELREIGYIVMTAEEFSAELQNAEMFGRQKEKCADTVTP